MYPPPISPQSLFYNHPLYDLLCIYNYSTAISSFIAKAYNKFPKISYYYGNLFLQKKHTRCIILPNAPYYANGF